MFEDEIFETKVLDGSRNGATVEADEVVRGESRRNHLGGGHVLTLVGIVVHLAGGTVVVPLAGLIQFLEGIDDQELVGRFEEATSYPALEHGLLARDGGSSSGRRRCH